MQVRSLEVLLFLPLDSEKKQETMIAEVETEEVETEEVETEEVETEEVEEIQIVSKKTGLANRAITAISRSEPNVIDAVKKREMAEMVVIEEAEMETEEVDSNDVMIEVETEEVETEEVETEEVETEEVETVEVETVEMDSNDVIIEVETEEVETVKMDSNDVMIEVETEEVAIIEIVNKHEGEIGIVRDVEMTISLSELNVTDVESQRVGVDQVIEVKDEKVIVEVIEGLREETTEEMIHEEAQETIRIALIIVEAKEEAAVQETTEIEIDADYA